MSNPDKQPVDQAPIPSDEESTPPAPIDQFRWGSTMTEDADDDAGAEDPVVDLARTVPNPPI
jgi:hypothetical protein